MGAAGLLSRAQLPTPKAGILKKIKMKIVAKEQNVNALDANGSLTSRRSSLMCDMKIGGALVSAYLQNAKNREPPRFIGICSVDLSPERVVQIMRAKPGGNVVAKLVRQEGFETHWLLIAE